MNDQYDYRTVPPRPRLPIYEGKTILAVADGLTREPGRPYAYDCSRGLTSEEYDRCVNWAARRMFGRNVLRLAPEDDAA